MPRKIFTKRGRFTTPYIRGTIAREKRRKIKAVSLNEQRLTIKQITLLKEAGWRRYELVGRWIWVSPKRK